jgi:hypothetical protein
LSDKEFGIIPVTATTELIQDGSATGTISLSSQPGFKLLSGGNLAGTYTIPRCSHCGPSTFLISLTIPGSGNTITLTLGAAKLS